MQHPVPEITTEAACLLASFDRPAVRMLLPPPPGKVALVALLSAEWGCEGASSMEQQAALNAAWVAEADAVLLGHYTSIFNVQLWHVGAAVAAGDRRPRRARRALDGRRVPRAVGAAAALPRALRALPDRRLPPAAARNCCHHPPSLRTCTPRFKASLRYIAAL